MVAAVERAQVGAAIVNHYYWFRAAAEAGGQTAMQSKLHYFGGGDPGALLNASGQRSSERARSRSWLGHSWISWSANRVNAHWSQAATLSIRWAAVSRIA